jgi:dTDP-4-dehydrorhamnose reductase
MKNNIILGYGILGKEFVKQTNWDYLSRSSNKNFDFENIDSYKNIISTYDTVINCIANTNTYSNNRLEHWNINYKAVSNLVELCNKNNQKLVHISSDYIYSGSVSNASINDVPVHNQTWYGYSKLLGDGYVQLKANHYLIIRCGHKSKPFIHDKAFKDVIGNFDYVDKIAELIIELINNNIKGIKNVGTSLKTMYDLALETKSDVIKSKCENELMPKDTSMSIKK